MLEIEDGFDVNDIFYDGFELDEINKFKLTNYLHHDTIKAKMSV